MAEFDMGMLLQALGGAAQQQTGGQAQTPAAGQDTVAGMSPTAFVALLGNLANVVGEGKTLGAQVGQMAAQSAQAQELQQGQQQGQGQLADLLQSLTGEGVTTTGVKVGEDGTLQVTGTRPNNRVQAVGQTPAPREQKRPF